MSLSLRDRLSEKEILIVPGAYDALTARLIEASGFEAAYLSGAGVSYSSLGKPDIGLVSQTEMADRVACLAGVISIPLIADADTGYGDVDDVIRTVKLFEQAGAAAIQIEDQQFPKRCGHLEGKELIPTVEMVDKIHAALSARKSNEFLVIARTDARSVISLDEAIIRGQNYVDAGADMLFVESPGSRDELRIVGREFPDVSLMANMVEGGQTPLLNADELKTLGYALVIFPNSLTRCFARAGLDLLAELKEKGTTGGRLDKMMLFKELNQFLGLHR
ncbi:MAG: carboxyvinyl-carboxyphosphonate phosphorylmutase [Proteobacteria bacterium]|nr:carboxyvinyl-carboxyphosphonate phosphorylmutase [Pseudomonadota bacterium]